jgi:hypothetical protein
MHRSKENKSYVNFIMQILWTFLSEVEDMTL